MINTEYSNFHHSFFGKIHGHATEIFQFALDYMTVKDLLQFKQSCRDAHAIINNNPINKWKILREKATHLAKKIIPPITDSNSAITRAMVLPYLAYIQSLTSFKTAQETFEEAQKVIDYPSIAGFRHSLTILFIRRVAKVDSNKANDLIEDLIHKSSSNLQESNFNAIAKIQLKIDPEKAFSTANDKLTSPCRDQIVLGIVKAYSFKNSDLALEKSNLITDNYLKCQAFVAIAKQLRKPQQATQLLQKALELARLPENSKDALINKVNAFCTLASAIKDPAQARKYYDEAAEITSKLENLEKVFALSTIAKKCIRLDHEKGKNLFEQAIHAAQDLPSSEDNNKAFKKIVLDQSFHDYQWAMYTIKMIQQSDDQDHALSNILKRKAKNDPEQALSEVHLVTSQYSKICLLITIAKQAHLKWAELKKVYAIDKN